MEVLFLMYGTGGAEALNEVAKIVKNMNIKYRALACSNFSKAKFIESELVTEEQALCCINSDIRLVITDRSNGIEFQNKITKRCKELGVRNLVVSDIHLAGEHRYKDLFDELPNYVTAISDMAYKELIEVGFEEEQIIRLGNPAYIRLNSVRYKRKVNNKHNILFTSQGGKGNIEHKELVKYLDGFIKEFDREFTDYTVDIKLHPMEEEFREEWEKDILENGWKCKLLSIPTEIDFLTEHLIKYDLLIGICSTLQIQGQLIGIPSIFKGGDVGKCLGKYLKGEFPLMWENELNYYKPDEEEIRSMLVKTTQEVDK